MDGGVLYSLFTTPLGYYFFESCMRGKSSQRSCALYADLPTDDSVNDPQSEVLNIQVSSKNDAKVKDSTDENDFINQDHKTQADSSNDTKNTSNGSDATSANTTETVNEKHSSTSFGITPVESFNARNVENRLIHSLSDSSIDLQSSRSEENHESPNPNPAPILKSSSENNVNRSKESVSKEKKKRVKVLTILSYSSDNYSYCFHGDTTDIYFDFGDASIVNEIDSKGKNMAIFLTHYHHDHTAGIYAFKNKATIYGTASSQYRDVVVRDCELFKIDQFEIMAIHTPCHSHDHICYRVVDLKTKKSYLVSGDCIFLGGTGKFFEGSGNDMVMCIQKLLRFCSGDEILLGGHEYSENNLLFTQEMDPNNEEAKKMYEWCKRRGLENLPTYGHSTLADEKKYNLFFQWDSPYIQQLTNSNDPGTILEWLRKKKTAFDSRK